MFLREIKLIKSQNKYKTLENMHFGMENMHFGMDVFLLARQRINRRNDLKSYAEIRKINIVPKI